MAEKKILLVDYDTKNRDALAALFAPFRFQILLAADGTTAYESFKIEKPDLVILEAILPKLHGFDLTKRITQESKGRTSVIIVTGLYRGPQYKHEALTSFGAAAYFEKPYNNDHLLQTALDLLKEKSDFGVDLPSAAEVVRFLADRLKSGASASAAQG
ncbi:MAG: response regulator [Candidatus Aminicenantes bacterium]|nr:response regulator [Candidatus Aminicenantes bacterium]